jgi:hypothetical protein
LVGHEKWNQMPFAAGSQLIAEFSSAAVLDEAPLLD